MASLVTISQPLLAIFIGDHHQTPGGLSKSRQAGIHRKKLLRRPLGLPDLNRHGDYIPPASLQHVLTVDNSSDAGALEQLLEDSGDTHQGLWWTDNTQRDIPTQCTRILPSYVLSLLNVDSGLIYAAMVTLVFARHPEEFHMQAVDTVEAAGLEGIHRWGLILPNHARVSLLTYRSLVAVRYPELVTQVETKVQIGHFVPYATTTSKGGQRAVFWDAPKDLKAAIAELLVLLEHLRHYQFGAAATAQLLVLCNRNAVHDLLLGHGFLFEWEGGIRISTASSAAGATAKVAVIVQTGTGFLSGGRLMQRHRKEKIALAGQQ